MGQREGFRRALLRDRTVTVFGGGGISFEPFWNGTYPNWGYGSLPRALERLWRMCAHYHGQQLNQSSLGAALGLSHTTIRSYLDLLAETFMVRLLPPLLPNLKKRLVKSPRIYLRDSGVLHALLDIETEDDLLGHPVRGASWEGMAIENILVNSGTGEAIFIVPPQGTRSILFWRRDGPGSPSSVSSQRPPKPARGSGAPSRTWR